MSSPYERARLPARVPGSGPGPAAGSQRAPDTPAVRPEPAGNRAIASVLQALQQPAAGAAAPAALPSWSRDELRVIQAELRRLGLYTLAVNGVFGPATEDALVEAFGGDEWRQLPVAEITDRVRAAAPAGGGRPGEHWLRYGEMFRDGVLDITVSIGFAEGDKHTPEVQELRQALQQRQFAVDPVGAAALMRQAGRTLGPSIAGEYYVRRNALTFQPPAGPARQIHAVVRLIDAGAGSSGAQDSAGLTDGIVHSDVAMYSGHGRYGSGPDFDQGFERLELLDEAGKVTTTFTLSTRFEHALAEEGRTAGRTAWEQFRWREARSRVNVVAAHEGNLFLNPRDLHAGEFGAQLMYWSLRQAGRMPVTGPDGALAGAVAAAHDRHYRVLLFDGCRTQDYLQSIRGTPGLDERSTDILATRRPTAWTGAAEVIAAFLDSLIQQQSAEEIVRGLDAQEQFLSGAPAGGVVGAYGIGDNPVIQATAGPPPATPAVQPAPRRPAGGEGTIRY